MFEASGNQCHQYFQMLAHVFLYDNFLTTQLMYLVFLRKLFLYPGYCQFHLYLSCNFHENFQTKKKGESTSSGSVIDDSHNLCSSVAEQKTSPFIA